MRGGAAHGIQLVLYFAQSVNQHALHEVEETQDVAVMNDRTQPCVLDISNLGHSGLMRWCPRWDTPQNDSAGAMGPTLGIKLFGPSSLNPSICTPNTCGPQEDAPDELWIEDPNFPEVPGAGMWVHMEDILVLESRTLHKAHWRVFTLPTEPQ